MHIIIAMWCLTSHLTITQVIFLVIVFVQLLYIPLLFFYFSTYEEIIHLILFMTSIILGVYKICLQQKINDFQ